MKKDAKFYDKESSVYSKKRYPFVDTDYLHFFFKKRLRILLSYLDFISEKRTGINLLEIGCADGVVLRAISKHSKSFSEMLGIDISPKMIEVAKSETFDKNILFAVKGEKELSFYDVILEVGVLNMNDFGDEFSFVKKHLRKGGYYICSVASGTSFRALFKSGKEEDKFHHFLRFEEYDRKIKKNFIIIKSSHYGLFIPLIWKFPIFARIIQPILENLFKLVAKRFFHEKIYLLKYK